MAKLIALVPLLALAQYASAAVPVWGQCMRASGTHCVYFNDYYSQCQPGGATTPPPPTTTTPGNPGGTNPPASGTLNGRITAKGKKYFGSCADPGTLNKSTNVGRLKSDFGCVTPENSMKWDAVEPSRGGFNYGNADTLVNWATSNGKMIRGHTLVWHSQLPSWVSSIGDSATLTSVINNHISNVAGRFKGKLYGTCFDCYDWDVCNEILNEDGSYRSSVFYNVLGANFVKIAFQAAKNADGNAKLYINDYNLDSNNAKVQGIIRVVNSVNTGGTRLIDGIGTQMHLSTGGAGGVQSALTALAGTGLEVAITELDIANASPNDYTTVVKACLAVSNCIGITTWGVADVDSWRASTNPLLYDNNYNPKPAYTAVIQAMA
ncbi:glycoside hydrolase family 10 protein [Macrolepiota fuliginosa MF-IS2]|uniref:Beta-xylanase n=1 Tax=Macrolepiota fuliginosa MF-IS2 TaxID=1400762 RepID=A0A9P6C5Y6_9AGAR|nr:glycoside hydrolase family 10 protein [Macrolepiota fuliginosa MF-IS2]